MKKLLTILFCIIGINAFADEKEITAGSYICIPDKITGFHYNKLINSWVPINFNPNTRKKLLKKVEYGYKWGVIGENINRTCDNRINVEVRTPGHLNCEFASGELRINFKTLKYLESYTYGYIDKDEDGDDPVIEIGRCSSL